MMDYGKPPPLLPDDLLVESAAAVPALARDHLVARRHIEQPAHTELSERSLTARPLRPAEAATAPQIGKVAVARPRLIVREPPREQPAEAYPITSLDGRHTTTIDNVKTTTFKAGGSEKKWLVEGTIGGHKVSLIERSVRAPGPKAYIDAWEECKRIGIPVVETVRRSPNGGIVVTDVKADGSEVFDKATWMNDVRPHRDVFRPRPEIDQILLEHDRTGELDKVFRQARELGDLATRHEFCLPTDESFAMRIRPNGAWDLIFLDLEVAGVGFLKKTGTDLALSNGKSYYHFRQYINGHVNKLRSSGLS